MPSLKLYFEPATYPGVNGLIIEESADGLAGWSNVETVGAGDVGTYPDYISSRTVTVADVDNYFRIAWQVGGETQAWSEVFQRDDLPPRYTTPDRVKETTRQASLAGAGTGLVQDLIIQAFSMVQAACGPFDETDTEFIEIAPRAIRLYVEYLYVVQDPSALSAMTGIIEEKVGSYRYRRSEKAVEMYSDSQGEVPDNIRSMLCRFTTTGELPTELISTDVFTPTPYFDQDEEDLDKQFVVTSADPMRVAVDSDSYERQQKNPVA